MATHQEQSLSTKKKLSASLKKLMQAHDFHKISINMLVGDAHLNRNSFYYHFNNIFDLLKYTFEDDTTHIINQTNPSRNLKKTIYLIMDYLDQNKAFCTCAYQSLGKTELRKFLKNNFQGIIIDTINHVTEKNHLRVSGDFKKYVVYSHTELMTIHIIGYLENNFKFTKEQTADYMLSMFYSSVTTALEIANTNNL